MVNNKSGPMSDSMPALGLLIDLPLALLMWAAMVRFVLTIFIPENSQFVLLRFTVAITSPIVRLAAYMTPKWLIDRIAPLWAAFGVFIIRYYLLPLAMGYDIEGFGDLPLEHLVLSVRGEIGL